MIDINNERLREFARYYMNEFMEFDNSALYPNGLYVCESSNRESLINGYFRYPVIITSLKKGYLMSASHEGLENYSFWKEEALIPEHFDELFYHLRKLYPNDNVRIMVRMLLTDTAMKRNSIKLLPEIDITYEEEPNGITALYCGEKAGYCRISEMYSCYGNIIVYVEEKFRHNGIASHMLAKLLEITEPEKVSPMYWVDVDNTASVKLALDNGFATVAKEIVIGGVISMY